MCIVQTQHDDLALETANAYTQYRDALVRSGHLIPTGVPGVYGRGGDFERVITAFDNLVTRAGAELNPTVMRFPPIFNRAHYEQIDHINNFPDLMGSVHTFMGGDKEHRDMLAKFERREDWTSQLTPARVMMTPAICYPLYPSLTGTQLPEGGRRVDLQGFAFRHEPSEDPARMQIFRMHEFVRLGTPDEALEHRNYWLDRGEEVFRSVGLEVKPVIANDPFFGRGGKVQKAMQREQNLKYEFVIPICSDEKPTAIGSSNYHLDHFGSVFNIKSADGEVAHSACVGFGLERIALALFKTHGLDVSGWPLEVRNVLDIA